MGLLEVTTLYWQQCPRLLTCVICSYTRIFLDFLMSWNHSGSSKYVILQSVATNNQSINRGASGCFFGPFLSNSQFEHILYCHVFSLSLAGLVQRCVIIQKDENGFGLTVSGDNPVFVQLVKEGKGQSTDMKVYKSVASSCHIGKIMNLLLPLFLSEQQHFNQSCIPSLAFVWEGVCLPCTTSTPCRQQGFVCVYCSELFSHSHQALWVCQKFARFSREKQVFQMPIDADFKWLTATTKNICKEADGSHLLKHHGDRLVYKVWQTKRWFGNMINNHEAENIRWFTY